MWAKIDQCDCVSAPSKFCRHNPPSRPASSVTRIPPCRSLAAHRHPPIQRIRSATALSPLDPDDRNTFACSPPLFPRVPSSLRPPPPTHCWHCWRPLAASSAGTYINPNHGSFPSSTITGNVLSGMFIFSIKVTFSPTNHPPPIATFLSWAHAVEDRLVCLAPSGSRQYNPL